VNPKAAARVAKSLFEMGCFEISLGDTIGVGRRRAVKALIDCVGAQCLSRLWPAISTTPMAWPPPMSSPRWRWASACSNASVGGLGGCPYAAGASGNVATEDLVWLFNRWHPRRGSTVDAWSIAPSGSAAFWAARPGSRVAQAISARRQCRQPDLRCPKMSNCDYSLTKIKCKSVKELLHSNESPQLRVSYGCQ